MVARLSFVFLTLILFLSSTFAQEVRLLVESKGAYHVALKTERLDTADENLVGTLTDKQLKSIVEEGKIVKLNRIPITTLNWNRQHTHQLYALRFTQEAALEDGKIVVKNIQTAEEKEFFNPSLFLVAGFVFLLFLSGLFRESNKIWLHEVILGVAVVLSVIIIFWTISIIPVTFPKINGHILKVIISAVVFTVFAFMGVLKLRKNLSSKYAQVFSIASMLVVGVCLLIM